MNPTSQEQEVIKDYDLMAEEPIRHFLPEARERFKQILVIADTVSSLMHIWNIKYISVIATQYSVHEFRFWLDTGSVTEMETFLVYGSVPSYTPVWRINLQHDEDNWKLVKE